MSLGGKSSHRRRWLAAPALLAVAVALTAGVAVASGEGSGEAGFAAQSLGIHYEKTSFTSLLAGAGGSIVALQGRRIETFLADGAPAPGAPSEAPPYAHLFPAAGGKTFVAGFQKLTRLNPDGSPDTGFGGTGTVKPVGEVKEVYELGSGRVAVIGTETGGTHTIFSDVRVQLLNADGSFVRGGEESRPIPAGYEGGVSEVAPTGNGGGLVVGTTFLLELNADGSVNDGFGKEGVVEPTWGAVGAHVFPDGTIETVGAASPEESAGEGSAVLRRYSAAGQPEPGFGTNGVRVFDLGGYFGSQVASWGADGSVVVGGHLTERGSCGEGCEEVPAVAAFDAAGELEKGFGVAGMLKLTSLGGSVGERSSVGVMAMVRRPDGSIVVAGNAPPHQITGFFAAFSPAGVLLPGFGEGGIAKALDERPASQELAGVVALPGGSILGVGTSDVGIEDHPVMVRYLSDGSLDPSFGAGTGYVTLHQPLSYPHGALGFAAEGDEVLTSVYDYPDELLLMAHAEDGSPVASFGSDGSVALPAKSLPRQLAFAPGGDPVVLGTHLGGGGFDTDSAVLFRYRTDGRLDRSFAHHGVLVLHPPGDAATMKGKALEVEPDGKILVGGSQDNRFVLVRLLTDGRPDPSFGTDGWSVVELADRARASALNRVGSHLYVVGTTGDEGKGQEVTMLRFGLDGKLDRRFGLDGRVTFRLATVGHPSQVLPTPHGLLVVISGGRRPLLRLGRAGGKPALRPIGPRLPFVTDVKATLAGGTLVLGWGRYDPGSESIHYHFDRPPLG